jgi:hypothetical protein
MLSELAIRQFHIVPCTPAEEKSQELSRLRHSMSKVECVTLALSRNWKISWPHSAVLVTAAMDRRIALMRWCGR